MYINGIVNKVTSASLQAPSPAAAAGARAARPCSGVPGRLRPGPASRHQSLPTDVPGMSSKTNLSGLLLRNVTLLQQSVIE